MLEIVTIKRNISRLNLLFIDIKIICYIIYIMNGRNTQNTHARESTWIHNWFFRAVIATIKQRTEYSMDFNDYVRRIRRKHPNISWQHVENTPKPSQRLYPDRKEELWRIWNEFWTEAKSIISSLNQRKQIPQDQESEYSNTLEVFINFNSADFFRDGNYSISYVKEWKELAIISFNILENKEIEVVQIQWKWKEWITEAHFWTLIELTIDFLKNLGFEKVYILKSSKNFYTRTPIVIPNWISTPQDLSNWLIKHREMMAITYDANPIRKWWFQKPRDAAHKDFYSAEKNL